MDKVGIHAIVKGLVQGVGYRGYALRSARLLNIYGWVKNLPDSTVEVEAFGDQGTINAFIKELSKGPAFSRVNDVLVKWINYEPDHSEFTVNL